MNEKGDSSFERRLSEALGVYGFFLEIKTQKKLLANEWKSTVVFATIA